MYNQTRLHNKYIYIDLCIRIGGLITSHARWYIYNTYMYCDGDDLQEAINLATDVSDALNAATAGTNDNPLFTLVVPIIYMPLLHCWEPLISGYKSRTSRCRGLGTSHHIIYIHIDCDGNTVGVRIPMQARIVHPYIHPLTRRVHVEFVVVVSPRSIQQCACMYIFLYQCA